MRSGVRARPLTACATRRSRPGQRLPRLGDPGVIDGKVITESIGTALAAGNRPRANPQRRQPHRRADLHRRPRRRRQRRTVRRRTRRSSRDPRWIYDRHRGRSGRLGRAGRHDRRRIPAQRLPLAGPGLRHAVSDANFACPALQVDRWTSARVPTFAYQFNDDNAPERFAPLPPAATHSSELQYIFDQPSTPLPGPLNSYQQTLASSMRAAWASFAANGNPSTRALTWPSFNQGQPVMSLAPPDPQVWTGFSDAHHCAFWATAKNNYKEPQ